MQEHKEINRSLLKVMQFFPYHIACHEDSVASKESQAFKPTRSHNTERKQY